MSISEQLETVALNQLRVYDAGVAKGTETGYAQGAAEGTAVLDNVYDIIEYNGGTPLTDHRPQAVLDTAQSHWNEFTENGARTNYDNAFRKWKSKYIYPKATIKPTSAEIMFYGNENIVELPDMDFSGVTDNSEDGGCKSTFSRCRNLKKIGTIKIPYAGTRSMFNGSEKLREIKKLIVTEDTYFHFTFDACYALEEIRFEGTIGNPNGVTNGGLSFHTCYPLSAESVINVLTCLKDYSGTDEEYLYSVKFHSDTWARVEEYGKAPTGVTWKEYAMDKGWNI